MPFLDFILGGSAETESKKSYKSFVIPIVQNASPLNYEDCFPWLGQRVIILLQTFDTPQKGTVRYIGSNEEGRLCAGIEFDYNVNGMSGKVKGQKLFKCKPGHGLLIPVEYVRLLSSDFHLSRTRSVPNLAQASSSPTIPLEEYMPLTLPTLKVGDNVVWLGGSTPQTGIVRWIGRAGRNESAPIKVWMEMDDHVGFGLNEIDVGTRFGCAAGRGKLLPADELILLENYLPSSEGTHSAPREEQISQPSPMDITPASSGSPASPVRVGWNVDVTQGAMGDLIDFSDPAESKAAAEPKLPSVVEEDLKKFLNSGQISATGDAGQNNGVYIASAPPLSPEEDSPGEVWSASASLPDVNLPQDQGKPRESDVNGNLQIQSKISSALVDESAENYLPPFLVPPIDIVEFFRAEGMKGIQGKRNSCYIDVVLFSMFAFTDTFDPHFLTKSNAFAKVPDTALTKTAKKILAEQIVNPLRQNYFCSADAVQKLRELMILFSDKLDGAFLDIEEFMLIMFDKLFKLNEFISYDNGMKDFLHQVNLGDLILPPVMTMKQCLEMSFIDYKLKLQSVPSPALVVVIPRHHAGIIQATTIVPNLTLDVERFMARKDPSSSNTVMNLVAVICINDFHFVTFVKCGKGPLSHWVLFDSNPSEERPKVEIVTNMGECLESLEFQTLKDASKVVENKHKLPPHVQRLLSDIYVCIYAPSNSM